MDDIIYKNLDKLTNKALKKNEIAVAAVIVKNNKIISKAYNRRMHECDVTSHAEISAIRKAEKKLKDWRLDGCSMYVTLEPCSMCKEVIKESRLDNCWYIIERDNIDNLYKKNNVCYWQTSDNNLFKKKLKNSLKKLR